ncbi:hypothetical protein KI387_032333, partial [Taxus chinensis]
NSHALAVEENHSEFWHGRHGHLNYQYMSVISKKNMVHGLPSIQEHSLSQNTFWNSARKRVFIGNILPTLDCLETPKAPPYQPGNVPGTGTGYGTLWVRMETYPQGIGYGLGTVLPYPDRTLSLV